MVKPKAVLLGFFGRGNAGDEAFLHAQYSLFCDTHDIIIVVEKGGAHPDFASWEPYNQCEVWGFDDVNKLYNPEMSFLHVGGGSLPFAYAGHFILSALDAKIPVYMTGVDASVKPRSGPDDIKKLIYSRLNFLSVRSEKSIKNLSKHCDLPNLHHGADWALGLKNANTAYSGIDIVVTMRGFSHASSLHIENRHKLSSCISSLGRSITWLPFAPDDRDFLAYTGVPAKNVLNLWHDPRQVLDVIGKSKLVISVGRLHSLIFAKISSVPCIAIDPFIIQGGKHIPNRKNLFFCEEHSIPFYESIEHFIEDPSFEDVLMKNDRLGFSETYASRFKDMISHLPSS